MLIEIFLLNIIFNIPIKIFYNIFLFKFYAKRKIISITNYSSSSSLKLSFSFLIDSSKRALPYSSSALSWIFFLIFFSNPKKFNSIYSKRTKLANIIMISDKLTNGEIAYIILSANENYFFNMNK